jgi:hypothetical protein
LTGQAPHPNDGGVVGLMTATTHYKCYAYDDEVGFVKQPRAGIVSYLRRDDWIIDSFNRAFSLDTRLLCEMDSQAF